MKVKIPVNEMHEKYASENIRSGLHDLIVTMDNVIQKVSSYSLAP